MKCGVKLCAVGTFSMLVHSTCSTAQSLDRAREQGCYRTARRACSLQPSPCERGDCRKVGSRTCPRWRPAPRRSGPFPLAARSPSKFIDSPYRYLDPGRRLRAPGPLKALSLHVHPPVYALEPRPTPRAALSPARSVQSRWRRPGERAQQRGNPRPGHRSSAANAPGGMHSATPHRRHAIGAGGAATSALSRRYGPGIEQRAVHRREGARARGRVVHGHPAQRPSASAKAAPSSATSATRAPGAAATRGGSTRPAGPEVDDGQAAVAVTSTSSGCGSA